MIHESLSRHIFSGADVKNIVALAPTATRTAMHWVRRLGGPGLIVVGLIDNSVIPTPGWMDAATIVLAAREPDLWLYFAFMATVGALIGGYVTYRLALKNGKDAILRRMSQRRANRVFKTFERWGFAAIAIPALMPPPMPLVPFLLAAGAMQYSWKKFLGALALGRSVRYGLLAYLGARYGRHIISFFSKYEYAVIIAMVVASVAAVAASIYGYWKTNSKKRGK